MGGRLTCNRWGRVGSTAQRTRHLLLRHAQGRCSQFTSSESLRREAYIDVSLALRLQDTKVRSMGIQFSLFISQFTKRNEIITSGQVDKLWHHSCTCLATPYVHCTCLICLMQPTQLHCSHIRTCTLCAQGTVWKTGKKNSSSNFNYLRQSYRKICVT